MKLRELFEERDPLFTFTKEKFDALPEVNASNVEGSFKVGKVAFDQSNGFGATGNNRNIIYRGFVAEMKPSTFINLAKTADRSEDGKKFEGFIQQHAPMGSPMLYVEVNDEDYTAGKALRVRVVGHEGRGRMAACREVNGDTYIPVHMFLNGGMRARDLNEKFFTDLRSAGIVYEEGSKIATPLKLTLGKIFWSGKTL